MASKLTVYIDDSLMKLLKDETETMSLSQVVNDALESYFSVSLVRDLPSSKNNGRLPLLSEVIKKRPKSRSPSAWIIANQRRGRKDRLSRRK
ncbi:MAG: hypothetical protein OK439_05580 [Thaumarchaeota archaeon]|nr:hypothetical protein [Nitrososphaerota archaeon]